MAQEPAPRPPSIKGTLLLSRLAFVREQRQEEGVQRVLGGMLAGDRRALGSTLLPFAWYAVELAARLDDAIAAEFGAGDEIFLLLGARAADEELGSRRLASPQAMLKQSCATHGVFYDTGRREYLRTGQSSAMVRTLGVAAAWEANCLMIVGFYRKALTLSGGRSAKVSHPLCLARGDEHCEYMCTWEEPPPDTSQKKKKPTTPSEI